MRHAFPPRLSRSSSPAWQPCPHLIWRALSLLGARGWVGPRRMARTCAVNPLSRHPLPGTGWSGPCTLGPGRLGSSLPRLDSYVLALNPGPPSHCLPVRSAPQRSLPTLGWWHLGAPHAASSAAGTWLGGPCSSGSHTLDLSSVPSALLSRCRPYRRVSLAGLTS